MIEEKLKSIGEFIIAALIGPVVLIIPMSFFLSFAVGTALIKHLRPDFIFPNIWFLIPKLVEYLFIVFVIGIILKTFSGYPGKKEDKKC
jgi:hypothetical protein